MKNSNCCDASGNNTTSCCPSEEKKKGNNIKSKAGLLILGLSVILAVTTAFSISNKEQSIESCEPTDIGDYELFNSKKKVLYVLLTGTDSAINKKLSGRIKSVASEINDTDGSAEVITLSSENKNYSTLAKSNGVKAFPAVLVVGKNAKTVTYDRSVKTISLLRAYDQAALASSCSVGQKSSSCCSKK